VTPEVLLTIWRHGEAACAPRDADRELTERGRDEVATAAAAFTRWLTQSGQPQVEQLRHSPLTRTSQTAAILHGVLRPASCVADEALAPGADPVHQRWQVIDGTHLLWVSHEPFVSRAIAVWSDDETLPPLAPSGYATLDVLSLERGGATVLRHRSSPRGGVL
jgi:phosphohistidine phosphatase SixA